MKLDRNVTSPRRGKYALIKLREVPLLPQAKATAIAEKLMLTIDPKHVDLGDTKDSDFFVIRLKDKYAYAALKAYAESALQDDAEYAEEVYQLALDSKNRLNRKMPD